MGEKVTQLFIYTQKGKIGKKCFLRRPFGDDDCLYTFKKEIVHPLHLNFHTKFMKMFCVVEDFLSFLFWLNLSSHWVGSVVPEGTKSSSDELISDFQRKTKAMTIFDDRFLAIIFEALAKVLSPSRASLTLL